ncbi:hypothetical protein ACFE04_020400 [Oxalis oulophora]
MSNDIAERAVKSLGKGFDLTSDFRLKYCKEMLVLLNQTDKRDLILPSSSSSSSSSTSFGPIKDVSIDIKCDKGDRIRYQSDILQFNQMSELFNQSSSLSGKIPSGMFNTMFGFQTGSWAADASNTKNLAYDGYNIVLFNVHLHRYPLLLSDEVRNAVPSSWDPSELARFIEKYGTHIIVGLSVGGKDAVLVRQDKSSNIDPSQLKQHLDDLGDQIFTGTCNFNPKNTKDHKFKDFNSKVPKAFDVFNPQIVASNCSSTINTKDGITVICFKRGGDVKASSHCEWLQSVPLMPDAIRFNFIPITSLLQGVPGKGFLSHAINLYLRYKPPISDLQYFLNFQVQKLWAPIHNDLPLGPTTNMAFTKLAALQFNLMGPKLYVNSLPVITSMRPVTGMRLFLEGMKSNRLAIHLQHLSSIPTMLDNKIQDTPMWRGSEDTLDSDQFCEPINRKVSSRICTAPVKFNPKWKSTNDDVSFIVTGVQLYVTKNQNKNNVLHLRLLFSKVTGFVVVQSKWAQYNNELGRKSSKLISSLSVPLVGNNNLLGARKEKEVAVVVDSSVYPNGPPAPIRRQKFSKFVETSQLCRGPIDSPGHWLVTGAKLELDKGKICMLVKFSLLYSIHNL